MQGTTHRCNVYSNPDLAEMPTFPYLDAISAARCSNKLALRKANERGLERSSRVHPQRAPAGFNANG